MKHSPRTVDSPGTVGHCHSRRIAVLGQQSSRAPFVLPNPTTPQRDPPQYGGRDRSGRGEWRPVGREGAPVTPGPNTPDGGHATDSKEPLRHTLKLPPQTSGTADLPGPSSAERTREPKHQRSRCPAPHTRPTRRVGGAESPWSLVLHERPPPDGARPRCWNTGASVRAVAPARENTTHEEHRSTSGRCYGHPVRR